MSLSIRLLLVLVVSILLTPITSGADSATPQTNRSSFQEGKVQISFPVQVVKGKDGSPLERDFNDGGTRMFTIIDAKGKSFDVYLDHRLDKNDSWGTIYLYDYPDTSGSVRLINQTVFKKEVLKPIGIE